MVETGLGKDRNPDKPVRRQWDGLLKTAGPTSDYVESLDFVGLNPPLLLRKDDGGGDFSRHSI